jgi:DNA-binding CsgD family transcriptional regulator
MREQLGMSNKQIADKLGVSYATILKYIGPQRKRKEK